MSTPTEVRWSVGSDQIDPDRWGQAVVRALAAGNKAEEKQVTRWGTWPPFALMFVLLAALVVLTGSWFALAALAPAVLIVGGIFALNRNAARRLAKQIRSVPSATEPFTFTADPSGTRSASTSASDEVAWHRYRNVILDGDLVLLTLDNNTVRVLPIAAMSSGQSAEQAVDIIASWMKVSRPESPPAEQR